MNIAQRADAVLSLTNALYINGQTTNQAILEAKRLANHLKINIDILMNWGSIAIVAEDKQTKEKYYCTIHAAPTDVHMGRVIVLMKSMREFYAGKMTLEQVCNEIEIIKKRPPTPTWLFSLAAAMGATALGIIFGIQHWYTAVLIFFSAGMGAILRRSIRTLSSNLFIQPFFASLVAGLLGALAVRYALSSTLRLVAVCPCMVLVPGPHFLNGALDFIRGRIPLGIARITYACLVIIAISVGLWTGLNLLGTTLPIDPANNIMIPMAYDMLAAGIAVAAYCIFFSMPLTTITWPIIIGMCGHALRWSAMTNFGLTIIVGSFLASLLVGIILSFVANRKNIPFAGIGFAAVVSMIPGVFLFRMTSGIIELANGKNITLPLLQDTIHDGMTAILIIFVISLGLLTPKLVLDHFKLSTINTGRIAK